MPETVGLLELEEVRQEYKVLDARGIPMSVRERYEKALAEMRQQIRQARQEHRGKKLGELLVEQEAIDQDKLTQAIAEQQEWGTGELLGEVLLSLGLISKEALFVALRTQQGKM